jgi:hypothetical protein
MRVNNAAVEALTDTDYRTRVLSWAITALRARRIGKEEASEITRCAGEFTKLANLQLEYAKAVGAERPVLEGPIPRLEQLLSLLERNKTLEALFESSRLREALAPLIDTARKNLLEARRA